MARTLKSTLQNIAAGAVITLSVAVLGYNMWVGDSDDEGDRAISRPSATNLTTEVQDLTNSFDVDIQVYPDNSSYTNKPAYTNNQQRIQ